ncbi:hypothetical protein PRECH8_27860 [Insulibacter thermoxylanivorax]|uniref:Uncharacterized protein n=1 Tax=Insulibacter thermoxylanivorax TaxID=2749268 RepID=A0A916QEV8_9BACL|nr:hypothetical protein [Insulibacter thermoxylanivorax]GFR39490.1 hypothetical protein PRECH8_27860 [Insulibacter thermoxylanivorax]
MIWILYGTAAYLTYYTYLVARTLWREGKLAGGIAVGVIALSFVPLTVYLQLT